MVKEGNGKAISPKASRWLWSRSGPGPPRRHSQPEMAASGMMNRSTPRHSTASHFSVRGQGPSAICERSGPLLHCKLCMAQLAVAGVGPKGKPPLQTALVLAPSVPVTHPHGDSRLSPYALSWQIRQKGPSLCVQGPDDSQGGASHPLKSPGPHTGIAEELHGLHDLRKQGYPGSHTGSQGGDSSHVTSQMRLFRNVL